MESPYTPPPRFWMRLFLWYCRPEIAEDIEGDLHERYQLRLQRQGRAKAHRRFIMEVLFLFRPGIVRPLINTRSNSIAMFQFNLKIAFRNIRRYQRTFLINLIGLSTGLACTLLIFLWVQDERAVDQFHEHKDQLYQVHSVFYGPEETEVFRSAQSVLGPFLREQVTGIQLTCVTSRIAGNQLLKVGDRTTKARGQLVEKDFFQMFSFPLQMGDPATVVAERNQVVLSEKLSRELFGAPQLAMGQSLDYQLGDEILSLEVVGIMEDQPKNSTQQFDFALSFEHFRDLQGESAESWGNYSPACYVLLEEGTDPKTIGDIITQAVHENEANSEDMGASLFPYTSLYLHNKFEDGKQSGGRITYVRLFSLVALFILGIACINFMNLATAQASRRLKEIGVKKAMGAVRRSLMAQQFTESTLIAFLSLTLALVWVALLLPEFNVITGKRLFLTWDLTWISGALGITFLAGVLAGSYPALYLSGFHPLQLLKSNLNSHQGDKRAREGLVVFQFAISILLLVAVSVVFKQIKYTQNMSLGYNQENVVRLRTDGNILQNRETFLQQVNALPSVTKATVSSHHLQRHYTANTGIKWPGKDPDLRAAFEIVHVGPEFFETLEMPLASGRYFGKEIWRLDTNQVLVNESAVEMMGLEEPLGTQLTLWNGNKREIIGVVKDFHFETVHEPFKPVVFYYDPNDTGYLYARVRTEHVGEAVSEIQSVYGEFNPGVTFNYTFIDENFEAQYRAERQIADLARYFAILAVLISCLGLLGLVAFTADRRKKEIGVRKVLGASVVSILVLLSRNFAKLIVLALLLALPPGYLLAQRWLDTFAFHTQLPHTLFAAIAGLSILLAVSIVVFQSWRITRMNPAVALQDE
ncbi:MAG TPA: transporter permease [Cytophagales bacterium]|nr:transporter permease [Cytophagales bacterium]HAA23245.1 transporter permease [Cytophagales bacterium]